MGRFGFPLLPASGLLLAALAVGAAALSGPGYRWGWWNYRQGFTILRWAAYGAGLAAAVSLAAAVRARPGSGRGGLALALAGLALGGALAGWTGILARQAARAPRIHDITTDLDNPPDFSAVAVLRAPTDNPLTHGGPAVAEQQRRFYPDIAPLMVDAPPGEVFRAAVTAARRLGWTLVAEDEGAGRIEAFDRTRWYGFVDDVVVRVAPAGAGSRIDVRSASRLGKSDIGANARRIRRFLRAAARKAG